MTWQNLNNTNINGINMQINWKNCAKPLTIQAKKERIEEIEGIMEEQGFGII